MEWVAKTPIPSSQATQFIYDSRHTITFLHSFCKSEKISHIGLQYSCNSFGIDWKPFI